MSSLQPPKPRQLRNIEYHPYIDGEGCYRKCFPAPPPTAKGQPWHDGLTAHDRLFYHQTLNSSRRFAGFVPNDRIPRDALDLVLQSQYQHGNEIFADKVDAVLSHETTGHRTFRRLRNTKDIVPRRVIAIGHPLVFGELRLGVRGIDDRRGILLLIPVVFTCLQAAFARRYHRTT